MNPAESIAYHKEQANRGSLMMLAFFIALLALLSWRILAEITGTRAAEQIQTDVEVGRSQLALVATAQFELLEIGWRRQWLTNPEVVRLVEMVEADEADEADFTRKLGELFPGLDLDKQEDLLDEMATRYSLIKVECTRATAGLIGDHALGDPLKGFYSQRIDEVFTGKRALFCGDNDGRLEEQRNLSLEIERAIRAFVGDTAPCTPELKEIVERAVAWSRSSAQIRTRSREDFLSETAEACETHRDAMQSFAAEIRVDDPTREIAANLDSMSLNAKKELEKLDAREAQLLAQVRGAGSTPVRAEPLLNWTRVQFLWLNTLFAVAALIGVNAGYQLNRAHNFEIVYIDRRERAIESIIERSTAGRALPRALDAAVQPDHLNPFSPRIKGTALRSPQAELLEGLAQQLMERIDGTLGRSRDRSSRRDADGD